MLPFCKHLYTKSGKHSCSLWHLHLHTGEGVITYMRTDGVSLSQEIVDGARAFVAEQYGDEYLPAQPRIYK